jgi:hypothetical protein
MLKNVCAILSALFFMATVGQVWAVSGYVPGQTTEAYAYTHGDGVGKAVVKVLPDGSLDVEIDEAFLPHTLAIVNLESDEWSEANTASYVLRGKTYYVAKHIEYDGTVYVGTTVGESLTYVKAGDAGEPVGGKDLLLLIIRNQESMAAYHENLRNGKLKVLTGFNGEAKPVTETAYGDVFKDSSPKYWTTGQTWKGNINAIEEFIEQYGSAFPHSEILHAKEEDSDGLKKWSVVDVITGATNVDFKDYFGAAQLAIAQLKME